MAMDDFLEPHKLKCKNCHHEFNTVRTITSINRGYIKCPMCGFSRHDILDENKTPDFLPKTFNISTTRATSSDLYDSLLYTAQARQKIIDMEDKNMKRTEIEKTNDKNVTITRRCDTSRGVFTVEQLEPTDLFVCVGDEKQTVYMAVLDVNNEPKYKTKKSVVNMETGELWYFDNATKIYVYKAGCELRVGEFIWTSEGYN